MEVSKQARARAGRLPEICHVLLLNDTQFYLLLRRQEGCDLSSSVTCNTKQQNLVPDISRNSVATGNCSITLTSHGPLTQASVNSLLNEQRVLLRRDESFSLFEWTSEPMTCMRFLFSPRVLHVHLKNIVTNTEKSNRSTRCEVPMAVNLYMAVL